MLVKRREKLGPIPKRLLFIALSGVVLFSSFMLYRKSPEFYENVEEPYSDVDFSNLPSTSSSDIIKSEIDERGYAIGIDLSYIQSGLNYDSLFYANPEVKFCMIRVNNFWTDTKYSNAELQEIIDTGDYKKIMDDDFLKQALACKENNIPIGVYYWPTCKDETRTKLETKIIIDYLNYVRERYGIYLELPVCIDIEKGDSDKLLRELKKSSSAATECVQLTLDMLKENNYYPMIYCNEESYNVIFKTNIFTGEKTRDFGEVDIWFASHVDDVHKPEDLSTRIGENYINIIYGHGSVLAQVSDDTILIGSSCVDINVMYKNLLQIVLDSGFNYLGERRVYKIDM